MSIDVVRVRAIRIKIELLRAIQLYQAVEMEDNDGRLDLAGRYEDQTRELCDEVEGLLRETSCWVNKS